MRCSALAKPNLKLLTNALVKLLPPMGMVRCHTLEPRATTSSVFSAPMSTSSTPSFSSRFSVSAGFS